MQKKALTKKVERFSCIILSLLILIIPFNITAYASDFENLVDSDLRNWTDATQVDSDFSDAGAGEVLVQYDKTNGIYCLRHTILDPTHIGTWLGALIDDTELVVGNEYTLSFYMPNYSELSEYYRSFISEGLFKVPYERGTFTVGLGYIQNGHVVMDDNNFVSIYQENYSSFLGSKVSITFTLDDYVGTPCVLIHSWGSNSISTYYYNFISDVSLVNNTQSKEDGFFAKLFDWFEKKFNAIGDSFSNLGNKLTELKDGFVNKITDLKESFLVSVSNLGNTIGNFFDEQLKGIQDFFRGFGNLILYFNWEGEYTNPFADTDINVNNGADDIDHLILAVEEFTNSVDNLTNYLSVPSRMLKEIGEEMPIIPIIVLFALCGLVAMRLFGVRRDN